MLAIASLVRSTRFSSVQPQRRSSARPCNARIAVTWQRRAIKARSAPQGSDKAVEQVDGEWAQEVFEEVIKSPELGKRGEAWFAAQLLTFVLIAFPPGGLRPVIDAAGWLSLVGGLALVVAATQSLGKNLTPLPKPRDESTLITSGIYSYCRHPMYGGVLLAAAGLSLALGDELRIAFTALLFIILDGKASYEEQLLTDKWGEKYEVYKQQTKKLLPYIY